MALAHLRDRVRARESHRVGVGARRPEPVQLGPAYLHLVGHAGQRTDDWAADPPVPLLIVAPRRLRIVLILGHLPEITGAVRRPGTEITAAYASGMFRS